MTEETSAYLHVNIQLVRGKSEVFVAAMSEMAPALEEYGWQLVVALTPLIGRLGAIYHVWRVPSARTAWCRRSAGCVAIPTPGGGTPRSPSRSRRSRCSSCGPRRTGRGPSGRRSVSSPRCGRAPQPPAARSALVTDGRRSVRLGDGAEPLRPAFWTDRRTESAFQ